MFEINVNENGVVEIKHNSVKDIPYENGTRVSNVRYRLVDNDTIEWYISGRFYDSSRVDNTSVGGMQLTAANASGRLQSLFATSDVENGGGEGIAVEKDPVFTAWKNTVSVPLKTYQSSADSCPEHANIDDLLIVTSDGTKAGEMLEVWKYDGFNWYQDSFKTNLKISGELSNGVLDYSLSPEYLKSYIKGNIVYASVPKTDPVTEIDIITYELGDIKDTEDYLINNLIVAEYRGEEINGRFHSESMNIELNQSKIYDVLDEVNVNNVSIDSLSINKYAKAYNFRDMQAERIYVYNFSGEDTAAYTLNNVAVGSIVFSGFMSKNVSFNGTCSLRELSIDHAFTGPDPTLDMRLNLSIGEEVRGLTQISLGKIYYGNVLIETDLSTLTSVETQYFMFDSQVECDAFWQKIYDAGMSGGTISNRDSNFKMSASIKSLFTARGISVEDRN